MEFFKLIVTGLILALVASCGDPRTSAQLRSPEEIKTVTDTFVVGQTTISAVYNALGPWNHICKIGSVECVAYWTAGGGETQIKFAALCPTLPQGRGCFSEATP